MGQATEPGSLQIGEFGARLDRIEMLINRMEAGVPDDHGADHRWVPGVAGPRSFPEARARFVRKIIRRRRRRETLFRADLFADPAWDMLLDLYAATLENGSVSVTSLCIAAAVPATTALRWITALTDARLLERVADPQDGRRIFIRLGAEARQRMDRYFDEYDD